MRFAYLLSFLPKSLSFLPNLTFERNIVIWLIQINKEMLEMKRILNVLSKVSVGFLTLVIVGFANSSGCYLFYQPKAPNSINDYKLLR